MHVVLGGAYNGKADWVRRKYKFDERTKWISVYQNDTIPEKISMNISLLVIEGIEQWLYTKVITKQWCRNDGIELIARWKAWVDQADDRQLVIIGTDITKGIVPKDDVDREWRDITGWFYQDLVSMSNRFDVIWYGINQRLK